MLNISSRYLDRMLEVMAVISLYLARLAGAAVMIVVAIVSAEVISRGVFNRSIGFSTEVSGYALAVCVTLPLAHVLHQRAHIRIDVLYSLAPEKMRAVLDIIALSILGFVCYFLTEASVGMAVLSYVQGDVSNTTLGTPLWLPQAAWAGGFLWFSLNVVCLLLRLLIGLFQNNFSDIQRLGGSGDGTIG